MTRTERSHSLRALLKDRSEARNGMDSSLPKGGAGAYNWGSIESEYDYENAAIADGAAEDQAEEAGGRRPFVGFSRAPQFNTGNPPSLFFPHSPQPPNKEAYCCAPHKQHHRRGP